jgi:hypothetical protein
MGYFQSEALSGGILKSKEAWLTFGAAIDVLISLIIFVIFD